MATIPARDFPFTSYIDTDPNTGYMILRALVHNESGLDYCLQKLPPQVVAEFQAQSSQGRAAHEQDDWETAESCFLQCKEMLREGLEDRLEKLVYRSLMAWVDISLAEVYQAQGSVGLKKVMDLRREILDYVMPLENSTDGHVVLVCESYCCTAQYELGDALVSSKDKSEAIQKFAELMSCSKDTAEAEICSLLCFDHEYMGRFSESLRWIREANRVRENSSDRNRCKFYFLHREAKLLMRLENFSEAAKVLNKDLTYTLLCDYDQTLEQARKAQKMLHECYMQMSRTAATLQQAKHFEDLAKGERNVIRYLHDISEMKFSEVSAKEERSLIHDLHDFPPEEKFSEVSAKKERSLIQDLHDFPPEEEFSEETAEAKFRSLIQAHCDIRDSFEKMDQLFHTLHQALEETPIEKSFEAEQLSSSCLVRNAPIEDEFDIPFLGTSLDTSRLNPTWLATTSPLGSSGLGLTTAPTEKGVDIHLSRLPAPLRSLLKKQLKDKEDSRELHDWETAIFWSEQMREVLKMTKRCLVPGTYDWLLSWIDLPLAGFYHHSVRNFGKALEIWKEIQECVVRKSASTDKLEISPADYQISLAALEYEALSFSNTSVQENCDNSLQKRARQNYTSEGMLRTLPLRGTHDIIQKWARAYCRSEEKAEEDLHFWLYFGYYRHRNFEGALEWLQKSKRLRLKREQTNGGCPWKRGPTIDYFCCDYDYNRCEIDLFRKLERHEEATAARESLESLLSTKGCVQEGGFINNINSDHLVDESIQRQLPTGSPTATGCILLNQSDWLWSHNLSLRKRLFHFVELVQSSVGLEHHLLKLPLPIQLAFRKHGSLGRLYNLKLVDWENAIFHYEWSLEILETLMIKSNDELKKAYHWLKEWVIAPLADLYEHTKKQYKTAFDLRRRMLLSVMRIECADDESMEKLLKFIQFDVYAAMYLCVVSDYPGDSGSKNNLTTSVKLLIGEDDWTVEIKILGYLRRKFMLVYANYEGALDFVRQEKQLLDQRCQEPAENMTEEYWVKNLEYVLMEALCLWHLERPDEIDRVKRKYWESTRKSPALAQNGLLEMMDTLVKFPRGMGSVQHDFLICEIGASAELDELRQKSEDCCMKGEYSEAISYREHCLRLIQENPKLDGLDNSQDVRLGIKDNVRIADLYFRMLCEAVLSGRQPTKGFAQNEDFLHAVEYYMKCLRQLSTGLMFGPFQRDMIAMINLELLRVYVGMWAQYDMNPESVLHRMVMNTRSCDEDNSMQEPDQASRQALLQDFLELKTYFERLRKLPIQELGERLISQLTYSLHTMGRKQYTEGWIEWLEYNKEVYSILQHYHLRTAEVISCLEKISFRIYTQRVVLVSVSESFSVSVSQWNAFLFGEGERTQVMKYQLEMYRRKSLGPYVPQWGLDAHDSDALKYIKESCCALLDRESAVFVQYSARLYELPKPVASYYIYVIMIDQDGCQLFVESTKSLDQDEGITKSPKELTPEKRLCDLYKYLAYKQQHPEDKEIRKDNENNRRLLKHLTITSDKSMNEYLEFLYGALLGPIAQHLGKKPGHKLVIAPSELLMQVPFAALRNPEDHKYLIESRALAIAPSLRILQMCSERLQDLQSSSHPYTGRPGSVLALGDPTYNQCDECSQTDSNRKGLKATGKELDKIIALFGETAVMKLTKTEATAKQLLEWAAKPSQESFRQAILHIGAHGVIDDGPRGNHRNNHLQLACGPSVSTNSANSASTSSSTRGKPDDEQTEDDCSDDDKPDDEQPEDDCSDDDISDSISDSKVELVTEDDSNCVRSLFHDLHRHMPRFMHTATSDGSSRSRNDAKIKRSGHSGGPSASSHDLTVDVINNLDTRWNAELLVLSACQTSAGRTTAEGVLSLARAFMAAGVPCVVASLWKVDDNSTLDLMECFYDELCNGRDVASALQCATLNSMRKNGSDAVQYWAPFNVWGVPSLCLPKELQKKKSVGINYSRFAPPGELPPPSDVVHLLKRKHSCI